eukprot:m.237869 g.237869  ORF g.237869 m.237869 type:complete len:50 (-) comp54340_c2_seq2:184-333(-)
MFDFKRKRRPSVTGRKSRLDPGICQLFEQAVDDRCYFVPWFPLPGYLQT